MATLCLGWVAAAARLRAAIAKYFGTVLESADQGALQ
jgi:hypothetical protein